MRDHHEDLHGFLADCDYSELRAELGIDGNDQLPLVAYIRSSSALEIDALLSTTFRLCGEEDLDDDDVLFLASIRELCYAHVALIDLVTDDDRFSVDPRRFFDRADDDLFFIAHYAEQVAQVRGEHEPHFPALDIKHREVATTVAAILAAIIARGYDPLPTSDPVIVHRLGLYIMRQAVAAGDAMDIIAYIHDLPQYAARCAAPRFASSYIEGSDGYDSVNAEAILTAVLDAADDGSDDPDEQLEDGD